MYLLLNVVGEAQIGKEKEAGYLAWEVKQFWAILICAIKLSKTVFCKMGHSTPLFLYFGLFNS